MIAGALLKNAEAAKAAGRQPALRTVVCGTRLLSLPFLTSSFTEPPSLIRKKIKRHTRRSQPSREWLGASFRRRLRRPGLARRGSHAPEWHPHGRDRSHRQRVASEPRPPSARLARQHGDREGFAGDCRRFAFVRARFPTRLSAQVTDPQRKTPHAHAQLQMAQPSQAQPIRLPPPPSRRFLPLHLALDRLQPATRLAPAPIQRTRLARHPRPVASHCAPFTRVGPIGVEWQLWRGGG